MATKEINWKLVSRDVLSILMTLFLGLVISVFAIITYESIFGRGLEKLEELPENYEYISEFILILLFFIGFYRCTRFEPYRSFAHLCAVLSVFLLINCFYLFSPNLDWGLFIQNAAIMICMMLLAFFTRTVVSKKNKI